MSGQSEPFRIDADGLSIYLRLTPRASKNAITGIEHVADGRSRVAAKVRAVPEKGAANSALERLVADWLDVAKDNASIKSGATSRLKTVHITGNPKVLEQTLRGKLQALEDVAETG